MPGFSPDVFYYPLLCVAFLFATFTVFFRRNPTAEPPTEPGEEELVPRGEPNESGDAAPEPAPSLWAAHYDRIVPLLIATVFYLLCIWRLSDPLKTVFDEVHHTRTAMEFVLGQNPHEWTHPPLSKLIQALSMYLAHVRFDPADGVWNPDQSYSPVATTAWRLPSVIFGTLALLGQYALARALFKNREIATLSMLFLSLDGVFFVQSRIAMTNIFTVCFIIWAAWAAWRWVEEQKARHIFTLGICAGLAVATRWSSLYAYFFLILFVLADGIAHWHRLRYSPAFFARRAALFIGALLVVPTVLYLASYIPFVLQGAGTWQQKLFDPQWNAHGWAKVISQQGDMYHYHSEISAVHNYNSPAWSWPLMLRPVWYFYEAGRSNGVDTVRAIWCIGNAFLWWAIVPALSVCSYLAVRFKRANLGLIPLLGLGQWFCWLAKARGLNFMHYLFEAVPFVCIALAYLLVTLWYARDKGADTRHENAAGDLSGTWRMIVLCYLTTILFWFLYYYPMLTAYPIRSDYSSPHFWLGRIWI